MIRKNEGNLCKFQCCLGDVHRFGQFPKHLQKVVVSEKFKLIEFALNGRVFLKWKRQYFINFCGITFYVISWTWMFDEWHNKTCDIYFKDVGLFS